MKVVNVGHDGLILAEYNGRRYAFHKDIPVDIDPKVYNEIIVSGFVNTQDIIPVAEPLEESNPEESTEEEKEQIESEVDVKEEETYTGPTPRIKKVKGRKRK
jgi:hypothetical protein